jgi:hypothetical protein
VLLLLSNLLSDVQTSLPLVDCFNVKVHLANLDSVVRRHDFCNVAIFQVGIVSRRSEEGAVDGLLRNYRSLINGEPVLSRLPQSQSQYQYQ